MELVIRCIHIPHKRNRHALECRLDLSNRVDFYIKSAFEQPGTIITSYAPSGKDYVAN